MSYFSIPLLCVDCRILLHEEVCPQCARQYHSKDGIYIAWPKALGTLAQDEVQYHDAFDEQAIEVHQLDSFRNQFYHQRIWDAFHSLTSGDVIVEVGGGNGFDAAALTSTFQLIETDISSKTLERTRRILGTERVEYMAVDGEHLPFVNESVNGVLMVAVWHHLEHPLNGLKEAYRVVRPGGVVVLGVEPNKTYFLPMKVLRPLLVLLTRMRGVEVSRADEEMVGFSYWDIRRYIRESGSWSDVRIRPMWLFAGWLHYILEYCYRTFRLKKRIIVPFLLEQWIVRLDELLFYIPGMKHLGWHWIVELRK